MMNEFLLAHQDEVIRRCRARLMRRNPGVSPTAIEGLDVFVRQVIAALAIEHSSRPQDNLMLSGEASGMEMRTEIGAAAAVHGKELLALGWNVTDVVHHYGDVCQAITDLAAEKGVDLDVDDYRTLNRCLDNAIAHAVTEFSYHHDFVTAQESTLVTNARTAAFLQELRKLLGTASLAFSATRSGGLSVNGATGTILERTLLQAGRLIENFAVDLDSHTVDILDLFSLADVIEEVRGTTEPVANSNGCRLVVPPVDRTLALRGNRESIFAALAHLLQNAIDTAPPQADITLAVYASGDRIRIDIMDPGNSAGEVDPAVQRNAFSLALARRFVAVNDGVLTVRELPGSGRLCAISLPRHTMPT